MRFDILTLFPELFSPFLSNGINRRAFESGQVQLHFWNPRDFADGPYRRVDDRPFGGGPGMVMMVEPLARCLQAALSARADDAARADADADATSAPLDTSAAPAATAALVTPVVLFSPTGQRLDHGGVVQWAQGDGAVLVCGRYEGLDQRFIDTYVTHQISLGDFVLSGGEIAALALLDAVARLQPGVLGDAGSHQQDSFNPALDGLLDCPHYTRPEVWNGPQGPQGVPEVLLSGHHARIERYRREASLSVTAQARPDLLDAARAQGRLSRTDTAWLADDGAGDGRRHGQRLAPDSPGKL